jgi:hypothetical protein
MSDESSNLFNNKQRKSSQFLPNIFRSDSNKKFLSGTIDPLIQSGTVRRLNGFIGKQNAKAVIGDDVYIDSPTQDRQDYQLEPCLIAENDLGNVTFFKDYIDYINTVDVLGGINTNHQTLNLQEFYTWEPHINWDKIVNYLQYYWLPYGPEIISISGAKVLDTTSTFEINLVDEGDNFAYLFKPDGLTRNPDIRLYRGETYRFEINAPAQPFSIKTERVDGIDYRYPTGVSDFAVEDGIIEFKVPIDAPDLLFYVSENNVDSSGIIKIFDIEDNTEINVEEELIGKKDYILGNGIKLTNGMKIRFRGRVSPKQYEDTNFYVEGVGESITLVSEKNLEVVADYANYIDVNYDSNGFDQLPFNNINYAALTKDYITINRSSIDRNGWSRYNRWFHQDVIVKTAEILGKQPIFDQSQRATRPIIEFVGNLKLFDFGSKSKNNVDLVDNFTRDAFSIIEGSLGYNIDGVKLLNGHRVIFVAEEDPLIRNKIYKVEFLNIYDEVIGTEQRRIHLAEEPDSVPKLNETVLVLGGNEYLGKMLWYNGAEWVLGQNKIKINQEPLFDLFDNNGISLTDSNRYSNSTFKGTKIFSYKTSTGSVDKELGFPLLYRNINNIGDILFRFDLVNDTFSYKQELEIIEENTDNKFLKKYDYVGNEKFVNGWVKSELKNVQPIIRIFKQEFKNIGIRKELIKNNFPLDIYDDINDLDDLKVKVYKNGKRVYKHEFNIITGLLYKEVVLNNDIDENDVITLKCYSKQTKNENGYYEFPINFQNNNLNKKLIDFTLGEVIDHVDSIVDNVENFEGIFPGSSNLRDQPRLSTIGTKFLQHSGSLNLALYHLTSKSANIIKALEKASDDYGKFKRAFIYKFDQVEEVITVKDTVDSILNSLSKGKIKSSPYYFSDTLAYSGYVKNSFEVADPRNRRYPLMSLFSLGYLSAKAVYIYVNNVQLIHERDYVFSNEGYVEFFYDLQELDIIDVYEYETTDGCFVPQTPTSLGLYPKFEPRKYLDTTLLTPQNVIQGHDGSIILAYNDFRDDLILELEKRIFNNIKVDYDPTIFDLNNYLPSANRTTNYSLDNVNKILAPSFFRWSTLIDTDFTKQPIFLPNNPFTYNFSDTASSDQTKLAGFWRGIYHWYFETDRIHICPWESLGFTVKPNWWDSVYGPAPYTSNNLLLWDDLKNGIIRDPSRVPVVNKKYIRPILEYIPVDEDGNLLDPIKANLATGVFSTRIDKGYVFGDRGPVETTWRRSSYYPFAVIKSIILMAPNTAFGLLLDRSRIKRNIADQLVYEPTGLRLRLEDLIVPSTYNDNERVYTSGLVNYIIEYLTKDNLANLLEYKTHLKTLTTKLSHRLAGYTSKEKFNLILDSKNISASGGVFIPKENYKVFLNTSSPIKRLFYSGVVITKLTTRYGIGYEIKGYSQTQPYFYYYDWTKAGSNINVGGISESFINWETGQRYVSGNIVRIDNSYFRVKVSHTSSTSPDYDLLQPLSSLPIVGGRDANIRSEFDRIPLIINYGTILGSIQEVVDFLQGYGEYLKDQGFLFDNFNKDLNNVTDWEYSIKEFLFWTTQNWSSGTDNYNEWQSYTAYKSTDIVFYNGEFYKVLLDHVTDENFDIKKYYKVDEINLDGAGAISVSPAALKLDLALNYFVVDNFNDISNSYEVFSADGIKYDFDELNYMRSDNIFTLSPKNNIKGIYGAGFYLIQKEHVLVIDNVTQFNDVIYNIESGYRQERIRVTGYKTINWNASFDTPGFIYDRADIKEWAQYTDYNLGDIVKYKEFYYTAKNKVIGEESFSNNNWIKIDNKPESKLLPNWDYKALQFTDFYDLESDNFDINQQRIAQHLIGYQKRGYLENIIQNDVSEFKFYQGMITEKGTANSLDKLFDVLSSADQDSLDFVEEWLIRVGQFGSNDAFEEIEFTLDESLFKVEPQNLELVPVVDNSLVDFVIRQSINDIYLKPNNFNYSIWPTVENYTPYLKTPGFVRLDQVAYAIDRRIDILNLDITTLNDGDYIWCGFEGKINEFGDDWGIYRFSNLDLNIVSVNNKTITFDVESDIQANDILGFSKKSSQTNFFTKVVSVSGKSVTVETVSAISQPLNDILVYKITNQRFKNIDDLIVPKYLKYKTSAWNYGELVWFTDNTNSIWQNIPVYDTKKIIDSSLVSNSLFGFKVSINKLATTMLVATQGDDKKIFVYRKPFGVPNWVKVQIIKETGVDNFGQEIAVDTVGDFIAVAYMNSSNNGTVKIYKINQNSVYEEQDTLVNPEIQDEFFGYKIKFARRDEDDFVFISSTDSISISGKIYVFKRTNNTWNLYDTIAPQDNCNEEPFAYAFDINEDASKLVTSACLNDGGKVFVYKHVGNEYVRQEVLDLAGNKEERFGFDLALSETGNLLAVSSTMEDVIQSNQGRVRIYMNDCDYYHLLQTIDNRNPEADEAFGEQYGYRLKFTNNERTLVIFSKYGDSSSSSFIGVDSTRLNIDTGRVDVYDQYLTKFVFSESLSVDKKLEGYGSSFDVANNNIVVGAPLDNDSTGKIYVYTKPDNQFTWKEYLTETPKINLEVFKKVFIYNTKENNLIKYLEIIDPIQGKISGVADQEIRYKTFYDPATYSFKTSASTVNVDANMPWLDKYVGVLWWDLRRARFVDPTMGDVVYRNNTWNQLYPTASIDVYEWVSSRLLPEQWDELSNSEEGLGLGISGTSLYGNNAYSSKKTYDSVSKTFITTYYYWVKNKQITPNIINRTTSCSDVANLIADPKNYGISYVAFLDTNSLAVANTKASLKDKDVALSIQYWTIPDKEKRNIHSEWKIVSENDKTEIPYNIERKWVDSLVGFDENGKMTPDLGLSPKQRYGIDFKPRQGMFINRIEAVKQVIERFNYEMKTIQIDNIDISDLFLKDDPPNTNFGYYDYIKDTDLELRFITTETFVQAQLSPIIQEGKIVGVDILDAGFGYKYPPTLTILGSGQAADIKTLINSLGSITSVKILNSGQGYDQTNTTITVRSLSVLVLNDSETTGSWTIYSYNPVKENWNRTRTKQYDVNNFWNYIDWYAVGYNQFVKIDHIVNGIFGIFSIDVEIGQIVKVNTPGSTSKWILLEKYNNVASLDYTKNYKLVGKNNGAIQISNKFYNFNNTKLGFDGSLYDTNSYDAVGTTELRIILNSFKNKILIDDRRIIYIKLFFVTLRYILSEQPFSNWILKSSFVKALHNVGPFKQKINYKNDNLNDYEQYIKEVKPFRTKIREFVSIYNNVDNSQSLITDFDLPPYTTDKIINIQTQFIDNSITVDNENIVSEFPWNTWRNNLGFTVGEIVITDQGDDYISKPIIRFEGTCIRSARAVGYIVRGKLVKIDIIDKGEGYFQPPRIVIDGGLSLTGKLAKAYAILGGNLIRSNLISMKFDRYMKEKPEDILPLIIEESFIGDGETARFNLKYSPKTDLGSYKVVVNGQELVESSYSLEKTYHTNKGYKVYYGILVFNTAPEDEINFTITYKKDFMHLNANERIHHYYDPTLGMLGRDFSQLMTGIDYGGVSITGLGFERPNSWDGEYGWGERAWDEEEPSEEELFDTIIQGGNLSDTSAYRTASGLRADDIIIDGDGFITPRTSPAPEEMLPGHVVDTLAIKVSERRIGASSDIITNVYFGDGVENEYKVSQYPNNKQAVIVKVGENILKPDVDYDFDFDNLTITLPSAPQEGTLVAITSLGFNGSSLLDIGLVVIKETTKEIYTKYPYKQGLKVFTLVSGLIRDSEIFKTTVEQGAPDLLGIRFPFELDPDTVVNYSIFAEDDDTQSVVSREYITSNGVSRKYYLSNPIGNKLPLGINVVVRVGNLILNSADSFSFTMTGGQTDYDIPLDKANIDLYSLNDYVVYIDNVRVSLSVAYTLDLLLRKIKIKSNYYKDNTEVIVAITKNSDYTIDNDTGGTYIQFKTPFPAATEIEIVSMFNHDLLDIQRRYNQLSNNLSAFKNSIFYLPLTRIGAGIFEFDRQLLNTSYVWLTKNKKLLTPDVDYILLEDKKSIRVAVLPKETDVYGLMTFGSNTVRTPISFMQFKDMLNRVTYKRISPNRTTELSRDLLASDKEILVADASKIGEPDKQSNNPGVVYINGERIEYFVKVSNKLTQLRRGTLGTGVPKKHLRGTTVNDIGPSETVPYNDETIVWTKETVTFDDSTNTLILPFVPNQNNVEVFVGTKRLRKNAYTIHDKTIHPESTEGDVNYPAEFVADGVNHGTGNNRVGYLVLSEEPPPNAPITVVLKRLRLWGDPNKSINESDNRIAAFLRFNVQAIPGTEPSIDSNLYRSDSDDLSVDED